MFDLHVSLSGVPTPFDSRLTNVDQSRLVRVEEALVEGLTALVTEARAAAEGNGSVAVADGEKRGDVRLRLSAKKDGKDYAEATFVYHDVPESHAKLIGEAFGGIDDAAAKG